MRKNFGAKPYTYPQPVFIIATYGADDTPDAMNAAWGGISEGNELYVHQCRPQNDEKHSGEKSFYSQHGGRGAYDGL